MGLFAVSYLSNNFFLWDKNQLFPVQTDVTSGIDILFPVTGQIVPSPKENENSTTNPINTSITTGLVSLTLSADRTTYFLDDKVSVVGSVTNTTLSSKLKQSRQSLPDAPVLIQANQENNTISRTLLTTDNNGKFSWFFYPPDDGTVKISAKVLPLSTSTAATEEEQQPEEIISIVITKPLLPSFGIVASVIAAFVVLVLFPRWFPRSNQYSIVFAAGFVIIGYIILYRWPPLDSAGNVAIATALFAPIAAYLIDLVRKERESRASLESTVSKYRDDHLKDEVQSMIKLHQEITQHQSVFLAQIELADIKLQNSAYKSRSLTKVGTIANLPGLRIDRYYRYIDLYNEFVQFSICYIVWVIHELMNLETILGN